MSKDKISISNDKIIFYDFSSSANSVYGNNAIVQLNTGRYAMTAGDTDGNGVINNLDFGIVANNIPTNGYMQGDVNMNGIVNVLDYSLINKNILKKSNIK
jgi:uncharacterized protein (DUF2141 family)